MRDPLARLCSSIDYRFSQTSLLSRALTHRSAGALNNERLEFLGDAILGFVIADELCTRFPDANEGKLSRLRARLVRKDTLAIVSRELKLGEFLQLGQGELRSGGHARDSILADALEAIFGAVYLDGGFPAARTVILDLLRGRIESLTNAAQDKDPKTRLQEYLQSRGHSLPNYSVIDVRGEQHDQCFSVQCRIDDLAMAGKGEGGSRRKAEQMAALQLLKELRV